MSRDQISFTTKTNGVDDVEAAHVNLIQTYLAKLWNTFAFTKATELTISGGEVTAAGNYHTIDTESDAASDDLDTIDLGTNIEEGSILIIRPENDDRTVVVKNGTGNILCVGGSDFTLDDEEDFVILIYDETLSKWLAMFPSSGGISIPATTAENDFQVGDGLGAWIKKTLAEVLTILGKAAASGLASLDDSSKVVQDPANATAIPTASKIPIADGSGKLDDWVTDADTSNKGKVELATTGETDTGTDAGRAVTPDGLAGSIHGESGFQITCFDYTTNLTTGDGKGYIHIPAKFNGMNLVAVYARVITAGTTGTTDIQINNVTDSVDMLSTKLTIDSGETSSHTAATSAVIDTAHDDVATDDLLRIDVDAISTTAPQGLIITLVFQLP